MEVDSGATAAVNPFVLVQMLMMAGYVVLLVLGIVLLIVLIRLALKANKALDTYMASKPNTVVLPQEMKEI
ncbi:hypothetical protein [Paenibacillus sp. GbtcB18]|uniref:hypothetical protein n=1 Tax=Paenibacillus sp. GbtcB18 TaxID=2824763 RepID=UPI001C30A9EC|nr:hypothetical protein [Paenibacillus sp. GbtcB18]